MKKMLFKCIRFVAVLICSAVFTNITAINMSVAFAATPSFDLIKSEVNGYFLEAKSIYESDLSYTSSVVDSYVTNASAMSDRPVPVFVEWEASAGEGTYSVQLTDGEGEVRTIYEIDDTSVDIYNLKTGMSYTYTVFKGDTMVAEGVFTTDDTPRFLYIDGVRNARDIGGWNGLNQGKIYRGGCMNNDDSITSDGITMLTDILGVKTDLDFRNSTESQGIVVSPAGVDNYEHHSIGPYSWAFAANRQYRSTYYEIFSLLADPTNYPVYMHCVGGADRTATVAFLVEALAGVCERDLSIDYELTSFSKWGNRTRTQSEFVSNTVNNLKKFNGRTLQEKAENYMQAYVGLNQAQISNIQNTLAGNGVNFVSPQDFSVGKAVNIELTGVGTHSIESVTIEGDDVSYTLNGNTLTAALFKSGNGVITFDDGNDLKFAVSGRKTANTVSFYDFEDGVSRGNFTAVTQSNLSDGHMGVIYPPNGDYCGYIANKGAWANNKITFNVNPNTTYAFSMKVAEVCSSEGGSANYYINAADNNNDTVIYTYSFDSPQNEWNTFETQFTTGTSTTSVTINVRGDRNKSVNGTTYYNYILVDDIELIEFAEIDAEESVSVEFFDFVDYDSAKAVVTNNGIESAKIALIVAAYDGDGKCVSVNLDIKTVEYGASNEFNVSNKTQDGSLKAFLWNLTLDNMPLSGVAEPLEKESQMLAIWNWRNSLTDDADVFIEAVDFSNIEKLAF